MLEVRALMATFQMPGLNGLHGGQSVAKSFNRLVGSLQAQLTIQAPRDTAPAALTQTVNQVIDQYESASQAAFARVPRLTNLLVQQGETTRQTINALKLQYDDGLINLSTFNVNAYMEIKSLTLSREVWPQGTPLQTYLVVSTKASNAFNAVSTTVQASSSLSQASAVALLKTEAAAYQTEVQLATAQQPRVYKPVVQATTNFLNEVDAAVGQPDFATRIALASAGFANALVNPGGTFGPGGSIGRFYRPLPTVANPLPIEDATTFQNLQYRQITTTSTVILHRNFTSSADRFGRFMTTAVFSSPEQAVRKLALDQSWYGTNQAFFVEDVSIPTGQTIYVGRVAAIYQGIFRREASPSAYPGGVPQYLVKNTRAAGIQWYNFRATGT